MTREAKAVARHPEERRDEGSRHCQPWMPSARSLPWTGPLAIAWDDGVVGRPQAYGRSPKTIYSPGQYSPSAFERNTAIWPRVSGASGQ
jgi:hypothetical protein